MHTRIKFSVTLALAAAAILITGCSGSWNTLKGIDEKDDKKEPSVSVACTQETVLNDCGSGFLCAEGKCERMSCETDSDCGGTLGCIDKKCFESLVIKRRVLGNSRDGILGCEYTYNAEGQLLSAQRVSENKNLIRKQRPKLDIENPDSWIGLKREKAIELKYDDKKRIVSYVIDDPKRICIDSDVNFYLIGNEAEKRLAGEMVRLEENKVTPPTPPSIPSAIPVVEPPSLPQSPALINEKVIPYESSRFEIRMTYTDSGIVFEGITSEKKDPADKEKVTFSRLRKYIYDSKGRLTEEKYKSSNKGDVDKDADVTSSSVSTCAYDGDGRLTEKKYKISNKGDVDAPSDITYSDVSTYAYDGDGRLTEEKYKKSEDVDNQDNITYSYVYTYAYDSDGRLKENKYKVSYKGDVDTPTNITYSAVSTYAYDSDGRLKKYRYEEQGESDARIYSMVLKYAYDAGGRLTENSYSESYKDGTNTKDKITFSSVYTYTYDVGGRLTENKYKVLHGDYSESSYPDYPYVLTYTYDSKGRLTEEKYKKSEDVDKGADVTSSSVSTYAYDRGGKLTEEKYKKSNKGDVDSLKDVTNFGKKVFQTIQEKPERSQLTPSNFACSEENLFGICPTQLMFCSAGECSKTTPPPIEPIRTPPEWKLQPGPELFNQETGDRLKSFHQAQPNLRQSPDPKMRYRLELLDPETLDRPEFFDPAKRDRLELFDPAKRDSRKFLRD